MSVSGVRDISVDTEQKEEFMMKIKRTALITMGLSIAASASVWAGAFEQYYDYRNADGTYSYYFETGSGVFVTMDEEWYTNTRVVIEDSGASFYHKDSYNAYAEEGYKGGWLFTIGASVNSSFQELPSFEYIGFDEENCMNYYAEFPTDYQAYTGDEDIRAEYDSLWAGVKDVTGGILIGEEHPEAKKQPQEAGPDTSATPTDSTLSDYIPDIEPPEILTSGDYNYYVNDDGKTITIAEYTGDEDVVEVPSEIAGCPVVEIGGKAFIYKEMKSLSIPDSVRSIGNRAFDNCVITDTLELPENVTLWVDAFCYAKLPSAITIPAGATLEDSAFSYCDTIKQVSIGQNAVLRGRAFSYCDNLEEVVCESGSRLEEKAFEYCRQLKKVTLSGDVETEEESFSYCGDFELIVTEGSENPAGTQSDQIDLSAFLTGGGQSSATEGGQSSIPEGAHSITLTGEEYVFVDCPVSAKAGETVTVHTVDVADGEVKLEVNGSDIGSWQEWGTYTFIMPDEDVELNGWISTAGYPGA